MVILITGKKGAGKTYYASHLISELKTSGWKKVEWIDGDRWRENNDNQDFSSIGRFENLQSAAIMASVYEKQGYIVLLSFIAPRKEWRDMMRKYWQKSRVVYIPGGTLWEGTSYEIPEGDEFDVRYGN